MVTWAYCLLLLALRPTAAFAQLTGEQAVLAALARADTIERVVNVDDPAGLYEAWQGAADEDIVLQVQGPLLLSDVWWAPDSPLNVTHNQTVVLRGGVQGPVNDTSSTIIDWGGQDGVMQVESGGLLVMEGIVSTNPASYVLWKERVHPSYDIQGSAIHPSVLVMAGSKVVFQNCYLDYAGTECSGVDDTVFRLGLGLGPTVSIAKVNSTAFYINGTSGMSFAVTSSSDITKVIGQVDVGVSDTLMNCVAHAAAGTPGISTPSPSLTGDLPASSSGSSGVGAWVWVLVALGASALLAACAALAWYTKRRRRSSRRSNPAQAVQPAGSLECELGKRLAGSSTSSKGTHPTQDRDSASPHKGASAESSGDAVGSLSVSGFEAGLGAQLHLRTAWDTCVQAIEGLELHSVIDRGGFATVFKGRWAGITVAVKVVEHGSDGRLLAQVQREAALATSVSHPNVIRTFKVASLRAEDLRGLQCRQQQQAQQPGQHEGQIDQQQASPPPPPPQLGQQQASQQGPQQPQRQQHGQVQQQEQESEPASPLAATEAVAAQPLLDGTSGAVAYLQAQASRELGGEIKDGGEGAGMAFTLILMEYADRGSLEAVLQEGRLLRRQDGMPDEEAILRLIIDAAIALDYLHSCGIVHGDIKAGNVLLKTSATTRRGYIAKLGDFGLSHMLDTAQSSIQASAVGTVACMSPERMAGGRISTASDVYSFGVLMWEVWEGRHAFEGVPLPLLSFQVAHEQLRPPLSPSCPPALAALMRHCWQHDPKARPGMPDVLRGLRETLLAYLHRDGLGGGGSPVSQ